MKKLKNFISDFHFSTKRKYLSRMMDKKVYCMKVAKKYNKNYWDGNRRFGYGGYKYIPGLWKKTAIKLIRTYKLDQKSQILDVGCGKGYLLQEIKLLLPKIKIVGFDISKYAISNAHPNIKKKLFKYDAAKPFPFKRKKFDLVISINTIHNLKINDLKKSLEEIERVGKKSFIAVESFRNDLELFNLQCWALTCQSFFSKTEWEWLFKEYKFRGDYEFIYFI